MLHVQEEEHSMSDNKSIVRDFIQAWSRLDPAELASYFTEDGTYHNMPIQPVTGHQNIEDMIRSFTASSPGRERSGI